MMEPDIRPCFDGEQWTDQTIAAWLAGFFDRAGRIDLGKRRAVVLTAYDLHPHTLSLIQQKLKAGSIETTKGRSGQTLNVWRISKRADVWRVLTTMLPYLTTQREAAYQAMDRAPSAWAELRRVKVSSDLWASVATRFQQLRNARL
jgi:hypothetical protein